MNNNDLADTIAAGAGITKADARKIVDAVFDAIGDAAAKGDEVSLNASKKLAFAPAKAIKDKLNG